MGRLGQDSDTRLYALTQCFWIFLYERNSQFFADVWNDCKNTFFAVGCLSFSFWVISSTIWYTFEQEDTPWMTSLPSTMYFTALFLSGEWHFADFSSGLGIAFCLLYCVFGVGLFALPVGMLTDSLSFLLEDYARDPLTETEESESEDSDAIAESLLGASKDVAGTPR